MLGSTKAMSASRPRVVEGGESPIELSLPVRLAQEVQAFRPLKICVISETVHAGVGRHIVDSISALALRGHEVHLLYSPIRLDTEFLAALEKLPNVRCASI